jgi:hypothetical protein
MSARRYGGMVPRCAAARPQVDDIVTRVLECF